jgi:tetratricopeptide (TPR) repeat protein
MDLARIYEHTGNPEAALGQVELALADPALPEGADVASVAVRLALTVGDLARLSRCLDSVPPPAEADLDSHLRLLELRSIAGPASRTLGPLGPLDRAIALGDWQSAYDGARTLSGQTMVETARLLYIARRLQDNGSPQAALNLLGRLLDAQPALPQLHALLTTVLTDLGRYDDALAANEICHKLRYEPPQSATHVSDRQRQQRIAGPGG